MDKIWSTPSNRILAKTLFFIFLLWTIFQILCNRKMSRGLTQIWSNLFTRLGCRLLHIWQTTDGHSKWLRYFKRTSKNPQVSSKNCNINFWPITQIFLYLERVCKKILISSQNAICYVEIGDWKVHSPYVSDIYVSMRSSGRNVSWFWLYLVNRLSCGNLFFLYAFNIPIF